MAGAFIWNCFWELNKTRHPDSGISYTEIEAYSRLTHLSLSIWEIETIQVMDSEYLKFLSDRHNQAMRNVKK